MVPFSGAFFGAFINIIYYINPAVPFFGAFINPVPFFGAF